MDSVSRRIFLKAGVGAIAFSVQTPMQSEASNSSPGHLAKPSLSPMDEVAKSLFEASKRYRASSSIDSKKTEGLLLMTKNGLVAVTVPGNALILDERKSKEDPNRAVPASLYFHENPKTRSAPFNLWILNPADPKQNLIQFEATNASDTFVIPQSVAPHSVENRQAKLARKSTPFPPEIDPLKSNPNFTVIIRHAETAPKAGATADAKPTESVEKATLYKPGKVERALDPLVRGLREDQLPAAVSITIVDREDDGKKMDRFNAAGIEKFFAQKINPGEMTIACFPVQGQQIPAPNVYDWAPVKNEYLKRQMIIDLPPTLTVVPPINDRSNVVYSSPIQASPPKQQAK